MVETENPYEASHAPADHGSRLWSRYVIWAVAGWFAIAGGIFLGQRLLEPIYAHYETAMPALTLVLLQRYAPVPWLAFGGLAALITVAMPTRESRRAIALVSLILATLAGLMSLWGFALPLIALLQNLLGW